MKKKLLVLTTMILISSRLFASDEDFCMSYSSLAGVIMESRQSGVSMDKIMDVIKGDDFKEKIVAVAFKIPIKNTNKDKRNVVKSFEHNVLLTCISKFRST